jgi:hypothetical protein
MKFIEHLSYFVLVGLLITMCEGSSYASKRINEKKWTEDLLNDHFLSLQQFKEACGKFPTTSEGLKALAWKPGELNCPKYNAYQDPREGVLSSAVDGWGHRLEYKSDGKHYHIGASHGYFVTDQSPTRNTQHWENPSPPPEPHVSPSPGEDVLVY